MKIREIIQKILSVLIVLSMVSNIAVLDNIQAEVKKADSNMENAYLKVIKRELCIRGLSFRNIKWTDDYDKDGLNLRQEYKHDTDPFEKDTDEDGLNDGQEVFTYHTDPCNPDTDLDNMCDGTEVETGLTPLLSDTDHDGIRDDKEIVTQKIKLGTVIKFVSMVINGFFLVRIRYRILSGRSLYYGNSKRSITTNYQRK